MPANTAIIGRVAVKVLPDTSDFRKDTEREIDAAERRLSPLVVQTTIDMSGASRGYLEELRKINARNRVSDSRKIRFHAVISTDGMNEAISKAVRQLNERAAQRNIKLDAALAIATLEIDEKSKKEVQKQLADFRRENSPLTISVVTSMAVGAGAVVAARLRVLTRPRTVNIIPKLDNTALAGVAAGLAALSGFRVLSNIFEGMGRQLLQLDETIPKLAAVSIALIALGGAALTSASNILALGSSVASLGGLLIPLPVLIGSAIVAFITLRTAFQGFGKAVKEGGKHLAALPTQMRAAAEAIRSFKVAKGPIQEAFWDGLAASIIKVRENAFPAFLRGLLSTAKSLNGFAKALLNAIAAVKPEVFDNIFNGFTKSIDIAAKAMAPLVNVFATLGLVGATYLPRLAQFFVDITTRFDAFLTRTSADGTLQLWVENAITAAKDLGGVLKGIYGIFRGLGKAAEAAGGSTLGVLSASLQGLSDTINSTNVQARLSAIFKAAHDGFELLRKTAGPGLREMFTSLSPVLEKLLVLVGGTIGTALNAIGSALAQPQVASGILALFQGIDSAVRSLAPAMDPLATALAAIVELGGVMAATFGQTLADALTGASDAVALLAPKLQEALPSFNEFLNQILVPLIPVVKTAAGVIGELVSVLASTLDVLGPLVPLITLAFGAWLLWTTSLSFAKLIISFVETIFIMGLYAASAVASAATAALAWAVSFGQTIAIMALYVGSAISSAASSAAAWIASAAATVASLVVTAAGFVAQGAIVVATMIRTTIVVVASWLLMAAQATLAAARIAIAWLISMGPIALIIAAVIGLVVVIVKNWDKIVKAITTAAMAVLGFLRRNWPLILAILTGPIGLAVLLISRNWDSIIGTITGLPGRISSAASGMWDGIKDAFKSAINWIIDKWNSLQFKLPSVDTKIPGIGRVGGFSLGTPDIPRLANGGFVKHREGGIFANIGEGRLDEIVLPLPPGMKPQALARILGDIDSGKAGGDGKTLNYYAAPNKSLSAEEDLFAASDRARMVGW